jgi:hypothetical protein
MKFPPLDDDLAKLRGIELFAFFVDVVPHKSEHFLPMLRELDPQKLPEKYDEFVRCVASNSEAPRRRDDGRMVAETAARALADRKYCVVTAAQNHDALLFRLLPPVG